MSDALHELAFPADLRPDISHLDLDAGEPVGNLIAEREHSLLVQPLYDQWQPGRPFVAMSNVDLFPEPKQTNYVPDMLLSLDVNPPTDMSQKESLAYFVWVYGKPPDLVVEVVSNKDGHEERKIEEYARLRIAYYIIFDPFRCLSSRELRVYELHGSRYVELLRPEWIEQLQLGATLWEGEYQGVRARWLRWCDRDGRLLPCGEEAGREARRSLAKADIKVTEAETRVAEAETRVAEAETRAAEAETRVAEAETRAAEAVSQAQEAGTEAREAQRRAREVEDRAHRLAARLRDLGIPEDG
ncbi:MAG: Uma2 family endonuclease [Candidatus Eremiobacterota bacterium]